MDPADRPAETKAPKTPAILPSDIVERRILFLRGRRVMLSTDLAPLYGVAPKVLMQAVRRNIERFPEDFMFQVTEVEIEGVRPSRTTLGILTPSDTKTCLRSQSVTLENGRGKHQKYLPHAFTEQGVAMLSSVLSSPRAVQVNILIMRAFVRLRRLVAGHEELARKLAEMEKRYDAQFRVVFDAIRELMQSPEEQPRPPIGFHDGGVLTAMYGNEVVTFCDRLGGNPEYGCAVV